MVSSHQKISSHCMKQTYAKDMLVSGSNITLYMTALGLMYLAAAIVHKDHVVTFRRSSIRSTVADWCPDK